MCPRFPLLYLDNSLPAHADFFGKRALVQAQFDSAVADGGSDIGRGSDSHDPSTV